MLSSVHSRWRLPAAAAAAAPLLIALLILSGVPGRAGAATGSKPRITGIKVNQLLEEGLGPRLVKFKKMRCGFEVGKNGVKTFFAFASPENSKYRMTVHIDTWKGFKKEYTVHYASDDPLIRLFGPSGVFSNEYAPPGPAFSGKIEFGRGGEVIAIAFVPAYNADFSAAVTIIGSATCLPLKPA